MPDKAWVISVNMGYGHQRTAYPLKGLAFEGKIINANDYKGIPAGDRKIWEGSRKFYEAISGFKRAPILGNFVFSLYDQFQKIFSFYPEKDLTGPNFALKQIYSLLKNGWGKHLIEELRIKNKELRMDLPLITTFFTPAFMAESFGYPGEIFCVICDTDISRSWAPLEPKTARIKYFAPNDRVAERLKLYGIRAENIFLTGYPLPQDLIGGEQAEILKENLKNRLLNLDPQRKYFEKYKVLIEENLGRLPEKSGHPLTILFSVGGAGAQKEIGANIVKSLKEKIAKGEVKIILSAGIRKGVKEYFEKEIRGELPAPLRTEGSASGFSAGAVELLFGENMEDYFKKFNEALRKTDILWTKPSELSFYSALGMPLIIAPPIGSQEEFNKRWLLKSGFGIAQEDPSYTHQWLFDWLERGYLAEAAMQGFIEGEKMGTLNIKKIIEK